MSIYRKNMWMRRLCFAFWSFFIFCRSQTTHPSNKASNKNGQKHFYIQNFFLQHLTLKKSQEIRQKHFFISFTQISWREWVKLAIRERKLSAGWEEEEEEEEPHLHHICSQPESERVKRGLGFILARRSPAGDASTSARARQKISSFTEIKQTNLTNQFSWKLWYD